MAYWLLKTEPETYSFQQLLKDKKTHWNGVRNYQARNYLKAFAIGDVALIYHSGGEKAVVGVAKVVKSPYPDVEDGKEWVQVDVCPLEQLSSPVALGMIKITPELKDMPLIKQSRLSVMPITSAHYKKIMKLSKKS